VKNRWPKWRGDEAGERRQQVRTLLSKHWLTGQQVAARIGCSTSAAYKIAVELGCVRRKDIGHAYEWHLPFDNFVNVAQTERAAPSDQLEGGSNRYRALTDAPVSALTDSTATVSKPRPCLHRGAERQCTDDASPAGEASRVSVLCEGMAEQHEIDVG